MRAFGAIAAMAMLAGCQQAPRDVSVDGAWVRLPAVAGNPGAAYFALHGGSKDAILLAVMAKFAVRAELHESMEGHAGMTSMAPVRQVAVPAGATVTFAPGGKHVMLFDVSPSLKPGEKAPVTLSFADGKTVEVQAIIVGAGDPAPK
ncbi:copper chaperone PCu(A)C [Sphingomonas sp. LB-2]|uniref:copper chaperone PCu(A)C n=1 Tax=Sphingomonas caeni TaxID=2984949 RepID=UPI0022316CF7|nr:copper chaperone PCu(A)C [Sphingomonas caeni]MCW3848668.1 copper chaperone PCu(A)C [Sphingomonas caeni]